MSISLKVSKYLKITYIILFYCPFIRNEHGSTLKAL